jgi:aryl-alcohol dehydrogenase-like predicted oxidoreductase
MDYIKLGTTGLDVSSIAIGAMTYGEPADAANQHEGEHHD